MAKPACYPFSFLWGGLRHDCSLSDSYQEKTGMILVRQESISPDVPQLLFLILRIKLARSSQIQPITYFNT